MEPSTPRPHGPWQVLSTREIYRDPWVRLTKDEVIRPDGQPGTHTITRFKEGVSVLPLDDEGCVYLTEEFHYAQGRRAIEVISGGIEDHEEPIVAAARELREEVGLTAERWTPLGIVDPLTSQAIAPISLFLAERLAFVEATPDGTETIRRLRVPFAEAVELVMRGEITHSGSCVLILKAARHYNRAGRSPAN
jgi:ADP-ribose pyrophosphatase